MEKYEKVYLNPNIDYVFCYKKETIIEESDCDMYEYNLECDKSKNYFGRTHIKGSNSGVTYAFRGSDPILNSCRYCLEKEEPKSYWLPQDAVPLFNKNTQNNAEEIDYNMIIFYILVFLTFSIIVVNIYKL